MKTLTTVATVAALIAGVSVASAQMTRPPDNDKANSTQHNSQAADPSNSTRSSGAPSGMASSRHTTGNAAFCISSSAGNTGSLICKYASMAACEKDAKPQNFQCTPNPNKGTTGAR